LDDRRQTMRGHWERDGVRPSSFANGKLTRRAFTVILGKISCKLPGPCGDILDIVWALCHSSLLRKENSVEHRI